MCVCVCVCVCVFVCACKLKASVRFSVVQMQLETSLLFVSWMTACIARVRGEIEIAISRFCLQLGSTSIVIVCCYFLRPGLICRMCDAQCMPISSRVFGWHLPACVCVCVCVCLPVCLCGCASTVIEMDSSSLWKTYVSNREMLQPLTRFRQQH